MVTGGWMPGLCRQQRACSLYAGSVSAEGGKGLAGMLAGIKPLGVPKLEAFWDANVE